MKKLSVILALNIFVLPGYSVAAVNDIIEVRSTDPCMQYGSRAEEWRSEGTCNDTYYADYECISLRQTGEETQWLSDSGYAGDKWYTCNQYRRWTGATKNTCPGAYCSYEMVIESWVLENNSNGNCGGIDADGDGHYEPCDDCYPDDDTRWGSCLVDSDGDGIPDDVDPFPDNPQEFSWRLVGEWLNSDGNVVARVYECVGDDGSIGYLQVGEYDAESDQYWSMLNQPIKTYQKYLDEIVGKPDANIITKPGPISDDERVSSDDKKGSAKPDTETGKDSFGSSDDSENIAKTTDNTAKTVNNTGKIVDGVYSLDQKLASTNKYLDAIARNTQGIGSGSDIVFDTAGIESGIGQTNEALSGIADKIDGLQDSIGDRAYHDGEKSAAETGFGEITDGLDEEMTFTTESAEAVQLQADIDDMSGGLGTVGGLLEDKLGGETGFIADFKNTSIQLENAECSQVLDLGEWGDIELDFCYYQPWLITIGHFLYALSIFSGYAYVLGRKK
jgi:hypothetical protein